MGIEFTVNSLEEMCDLMCDNKVPERKDDPTEQEKSKLREEIVETGYIYHLPKGAKP